MTPIEQQIEGIVDSILLDYQNQRDIDKLDPFQQPDKAVVIDMIQKLLRIVYPGFSRDRSYRMYNAKHNLSMLIEDVMYNLNKQIAIVLRSTMPTEQAQEKAQELSVEFFRAIPGVRAIAQTDAEAFYEGDPAAFSIDEIIFCYPGLFAVTVYRLAHVLYQLGVPLLPRIMTEHAHSVTGIDINPGATIGNYFFIDHGTGIVVGETTVIGDHVKIYQGVTLGALTTRGGQTLRGRKRHPTIEDNVTIYAGASILGGGTVIGRDSVIGSNVFITHSIPACTTVSVKSQELQFKPRNCGGNCEKCEKPEPFWEGQKEAEKETH
ncbi:MAG: serine O-acetyltransferase [Faecousia sp.]